ncbi:MAG TPA: biopolymer transporter ExbD [Leptolyngbyaceae cyanobacterium]
MRFKARRNSQVPMVNLVPMMDVLLTVLTFFIIVSMTLGTEQLVDVQLPPEQPENAPSSAVPADPFIVEMGRNGELELNGQSTDLEMVKGQMEAYLSRDPKNVVFILPSQDLPYEQVMQFLGEMREIGGDRVSLAIEEPQ